MYDDVKKWLKNRLSKEKYIHSIGSEETARNLAKRFDVDPDKAGFAALIHDNAKCISGNKLLEIVEKNNIPVSEMEKNNIKTLHSPVGAFLAQNELKINDIEILNAVRYHTVGRVNMSRLEKIVFLSDKIEPYTRNAEFIKKVMLLLDQKNNLDEAVLLCFNVTISKLLEKRLVINPQTIDVWNNIILNLEK
ncbi:MAG: bis(5'-nucleosyl)-tetraphosphatase (symmetrical) YqeK [bacterium]